MRPLRTILLAIALSCFAVPFGVTAAESPAVGTGSVLSGSGIDLWALRRERTQGFLETYQDFRITDTAWNDKWQKGRQKLALHITKCHEAVRKANRDTLLPVTLQCERSQLLLEQEMLKRERSMILARPGITPAIRQDALTKSDALTSAMQTVIDGIDAKVFRSIADLKQARGNLLAQYREPAWIALIRFRADAALTWIAQVLLDRGETTQDAMQTCFIDAESRFSAVLSLANLPALRTGYIEGMNKVLDCLDTEKSEQNSSSTSSNTTP